MGFLKKIFKPVSKVLDKVIPNEIKPALPYLAALAPVFAPAGMQGLIGSTMGRRALTSGLLNIGAQLSQEGSEGDINLLSAGLGALTGAMTAPGTGATTVPTDKFATVSDFSMSAPGEGPMLKTMRLPGMGTPRVVSAGSPSSAQFFKGLSEGAQGQTGIMASGKRFLGDTLAKGSEMFAEGAAEGLFSKAGLKAATLPAAVATGDVMQAQARQIDKQAAIDAALAEAEALADSGLRGDAIRNAMRAYGFFTDEEIESTVATAGYKAGGRVGFAFGGIDKAIEMVEEETVEKGKEGIMQAAGEDPLLVEEYNKYVFDLMEQRPNAKPMSFQDFKRMIKAGMKDGGIMATEIPLKPEVKNINKKGQPDTTMVKMKEGGLMDLDGKEMDLRGGGFVPIGKKEKADDVPARLSKNEFVMTADAVRAAGGGSVNKGAQRMYDLMNNLEARA